MRAFAPLVASLVLLGSGALAIRADAQHDRKKPREVTDIPKDAPASQPAAKPATPPTAKPPATPPAKPATPPAARSAPAAERAARAKALFRKATVARAAGRLGEARALLAEALQLYPRFPQAEAELGLVDAADGRYDDSATHLTRALALEADDTTRANLGEVERARGRCSEALAQFRAVEGRFSKDLSILRGIAVCEDSLGRADAARKAYGAVAAAGNTDPATVAWVTARLVALEARLRAEDPAARDKALASARARSKETATRPDPSLPALLGTLPAAEAEALADGLFAEARHADAALAFALAFHAGPTPDRAYKLAIARAAGRDFRGAAWAAERALAMAPDHAPTIAAYPTLLRALRERGKGDVEVNLAAGGDRPVQVRLAALLLEGRPHLCKLIATATLEADKAPDPAVRFLRAEAALRLGDLAGADADLRGLLKLMPAHGPARAALAEVLWRKGSPGEARLLAGLKPPKKVRKTIESHGGAPGGPASAPPPDLDLVGFARNRQLAVETLLRLSVDPGVQPMPHAPLLPAEYEVDPESESVVPLSLEPPEKDNAKKNAKKRSASKPKSKARRGGR